MAQLRSLPLCFVASALLFGSALMAQDVAPAVRIVNRIDEHQLVTLKGNTHPLARAQCDRGRVSPELQMSDLVLVLSRSAEQQAAFDKFVASQYDSASPNFHHWLEPEEVGERFGPAQGDLDAISNWLRAHGLSVDEVTNDRMSIRFSGTAAQVESALHVEMHNLEVKGEKHIGNMADPRIPAALSPVVVGVKALHNFFPRPLHKLGGQARFDREKGSWTRVASETAASAKLGDKSTPESVHTLFGITVGSGSSAYLVEDVTPYDFAKIYNVLPLWNASKPIDGTGQTIAIAGTSNINPADIASFRSTFGLPANVPTVVLANGTDPGDCPTANSSCINDLIENSLDVEWSGAVAKGAKIVLVTSGSSSPTTDTLWLSESYIVNHSPLTANILNVSYGLCELGNGTAGNVAYNNLWQTAASEGIAVFVATGDSGSPSCDQGQDASTPYAAEYGLSVSGLASTPYDTAVGGTDFNWGTTAPPYWGTTNAANDSNALGYIPEVPWNDTCTNPLALSYIQSAAQFLQQQVGINVPTPTDAESACNFVAAYSYYVYEYAGVDISWLVDVVGGSGGKSGCVVNDNSTVASCSSTITTTGAGYGSLPLVKDGWPKPKWQAGVTGIPADQVRDIPDVSFFASNGFLGSAYLICVSAGGNPCTYTATTEPIAQEVGGTSASSPAMAGVMALINQKAGGPVGSPNANLYALAAKQTYSGCSSETVANSSNCLFNDIDMGTNAMACDYTSASPNCSILYSGDVVGILPGYSAVRGFDLATGLGSLNVANVVNAGGWQAASAPAVSLTPGSLTFSGTLVSTASATQAIALKNTGNAALTLGANAITITGTNASSFSQTNNCGTSLAAGASCAITVTFKPTKTGALTATVSVTDNASGSPQTAALSGTGTAPAVNLTPTSLTFPYTAVGGSASSQVTLLNTGTAALSLSGISIGGSNTSDFSQTNTCGASVAVGKTCTISVTFLPKAPGTFTAQVKIADNASGSPQKISLTGTGTAPAVSLSTGSLTFASTKVGTAAAVQKITLKNTGNAALNLSGIGIGGGGASSFSQTNSCGARVAAGGTCTISVTFKPKAEGKLTASVSIADNATGSPQTVSLTGTGTAPVVSLLPGSLTFPGTKVGTAAAVQKITLKNTGNLALSLSGIGIGGSNTSAFSQTNTCGASVAAGGTCTISVTFKPKAAGTLTAHVKVTDNAAGSPQTVALTGIGQ